MEPEGEIDQPRRAHPAFRLALTWLAVGMGITGCLGDGEAPADGAPWLEVEVATAPTPPLLGPTRVVVELSGPDGPVVDAAVQVRARPSDSEPPAPLEAEATHSERGHYVIPALDFPSGGTWTLEVRVRLADGVQATRTEELRVSSGGPGAVP